MAGEFDEFGFFDDSASEPPFGDFPDGEADFTHDLPFDAEGDWAGSADALEDGFDDGFDSGFEEFDENDLPFGDYFGVYGDDDVAKARDLRESGHPDEAVALLADKVRDDGPWDAAAHVELGLALEALGEWDRAAAAYRQAASLAPHEPHPMNHLGALLHTMGEDRLALEAFEKANEIDPKFAAALVNRILCHAELGEHARAEQTFYLAQQLDERCPRSFFNIGRSLEMRGRHRRAIWCYRRCIALDTAEPMVPRGVVRLRLATCLREDGQTAAAVRTLRNALACTDAADPARPELLQHLAQHHLQQGDASAVTGLLEELAELAPDLPSTHLLQGRWHLLRQENELALKALQHAAAADPTYPRVHLLLARLTHDAGHDEEARKHLRAELLRRPRDEGVLRDVVEQAEAMRDPVTAATALRKLVLVRADDPAAWQRLGAAECQSGRFPEGLAATRRALDLDPSRVSAWHNLALALLQNGERAAALEALHHGLRLAPRHLPLRRLLWRCRLRLM